MRSRTRRILREKTDCKQSKKDKPRGLFSECYGRQGTPLFGLNDRSNKQEQEP